MHLGAETKATLGFDTVKEAALGRRDQQGGHAEVGRFRREGRGLRDDPVHVREAIEKGPRQALRGCSSSSHDSTWKPSMTASGRARTSP